jgi:hypothetical protein
LWRHHPNREIPVRMFTVTMRTISTIEARKAARWEHSMLCKPAAHISLKALRPATHHQRTTCMRRFLKQTAYQVGSFPVNGNCVRLRSQPRLKRPASTRVFLHLQSCPATGWPSGCAGSAGRSVLYFPEDLFGTTTIIRGMTDVDIKGRSGGRVPGGVPAS